MALPGRYGSATKGQVAFAVSMGALAAAGAALVLDMGDGGGAPAPVVATADRVGYEVGPFEQVSSLGPQTVVITLGEGYAVRSEGRPDVLAQLEVAVNDGRLTIGPRGGRFGRGFSRDRFASATFFVTVPRLEAASLAGSGDMRIDRIEGERFSGSIAGSGELAIETLEVDEADFSIAGRGDVIAGGTARRARISIAGRGDVRASNLTSEAASISILGSGDASLTVNGEARVSIMGSGDVDIDGDARCSVSRMGSGDVRCGGTAAD